MLLYLHSSKYDRKSLPSWLIHPGPVLLWHFVRNWNQPLVDEVEFMDANPNPPNTRFPDGTQFTVPVRPTNLASCPSETTASPESIIYHHKVADDKQPTTPFDSSSLQNCHRHRPISSDSVGHSRPTFAILPDRFARSNILNNCKSNWFC